MNKMLNFSYEAFMQSALQQARKAVKHNEVPVGAVIVNNKTQEIIAAAHNLVEARQNITLHAEILAISLASQKYGGKLLDDCDLFVTLEPCVMCAGAISHARIKRLVYGAYDAKQGAVEHGPRFFTQSTCLHRPEIFSGIMALESQELLQSFFSKLRK